MYSPFLKFLVILLIHHSTAKKSDDCEVCIKTIDGFKAVVDLSDKSKSALVSQFRDYCATRKGKENRFCYYVGGTEDAATSIINEVVTPLAYNMPSEKICDKLKKMDSQICELRYDKQIDLKTVDLKKLKVRDLRKILSTWDETCDGCIEKSEYIKRIEELKPKYVKEEL